MTWNDEVAALCEARLGDWRWRFWNLYYIEPADDRPKVLFEPREEQEEILRALYERGEMAVAILKARQLGFSTLLALICLDMQLFRAGYKIGIVDQNKEDAVKKLGKLLFAWENLPKALRDCYRVLVDNNGEFTLRCRAAQGDEVASTVYAGKNARGGTHQMLWISEWGAIQFEDPRRSDKIADGALPSAKEGITVVESTWRGGKTGRLYTDVVEPALQIAEEQRSQRDWRVYFFPWWLDEAYVWEGEQSQISEECAQYFAQLESRYGVELSGHQRLWYYKRAWPKREKRYEEFPSVLEEIFLSPVDGAVYGEYLDRARVEGRVIRYPRVRQSFFSFWDLGKSDLMSIILIQRVGLQLRVYDGMMGRGETLEHYARWLQQWERDNEAFIEAHYLPHDGGWQRLGKTYNKSIAESLEECGLRQVRVVPKIPRVHMGIEYVRERFPQMVLHAGNLGRVYQFGSKRVSFLDALANYRYGPMENEGQSREPIHDIYSHPCDAFRTFAEADERGLVPGSSSLEMEAQSGTRSNMVLTDLYE
ncbi:hypothetical protein Rhal01_03751 [Rubritalea halochordaticola]|uniref:Terminase n=1 Tax=Rubritalea halochordaticola TaxID=714537 RepID=A0ABP9V6D5_9BACT